MPPPQLSSSAYTLTESYFTNGARRAVRHSASKTMHVSRVFGQRIERNISFADFDELRVTESGEVVSAQVTQQ